MQQAFEGKLLVHAGKAFCTPTCGCKVMGKFRNVKCFAVSCVADWIICSFLANIGYLLYLCIVLHDCVSCISLKFTSPFFFVYPFHSSLQSLFFQLSLSLSIYHFSLIPFFLSGSFPPSSSLIHSLHSTLHSPPPILSLSCSVFCPPPRSPPPYRPACPSPPRPPPFLPSFPPLAIYTRLRVPR